MDVLEAEVGDLKENIVNLVEKIRDSLGEDFEFEESLEDDPDQALFEAVDALIEEYESEEVEEEEEDGEDVYSVIQSLVDEVEEAMEDEYDFDPDEDLVESLKTCRRVLLDEYEVASSEAEEENEE